MRSGLEGRWQLLKRGTLRQGESTDDQGLLDDMVSSALAGYEFIHIQPTTFGNGMDKRFPGLQSLF